MKGLRAPENRLVVVKGKGEGWRGGWGWEMRVIAFGMDRKHDTAQGIIS